MEKKKLNKTTKSNLITYGMVLAAYLIVQGMIAGNLLSNLMQGLLVPLCVYIILALSLNLTVGILGELSLGHAGFMCIGAFTSAAFFYALLSYGIQVFGRVNSLFSVLYFFLIPMCMRKMKDYFMSRGKKGKIIYSMLSCACVIYYVFRFVIYLGEYCDLDMIIPYTNVLF